MWILTQEALNDKMGICSFAEDAKLFLQLLYRSLLKAGPDIYSHFRRGLSMEPG